MQRLACRVGLGGMEIPGRSGTPAELQSFEDNEVTSDPVRFARFKGILKAALSAFDYLIRHAEG